MVYIANYEPDALHETAWDPTPEMEQERKEAAKRQEEQATLEMVPAVHEVKKAADVADDWLAQLDKSHPVIAAPLKAAKWVGELPGQVVSDAATVLDIASGAVADAVINWPKTVMGAGEIASAAPYAAAIGPARTADTLAGLVGYDAGLEKTVDKAFQENAVGRFLKHQADKSPFATKIMADMPTYIAANSLVGKGLGIAGWGIEKLAPVLAKSSKFAQFIPKMKSIAKSDFVKGMLDPKNLGDDVLAGSWKLYSGRVVGSIARTGAGDYLTHPLWLDRELEEAGNREYLNKCGLIGVNFLWNAGTSLFSTVPVALQIARNQRRHEFAITKGARQVWLEAAEQGYDVNTPIKNPQWNFRRDLKVERIADTHPAVETAEDLKKASETDKATMLFSQKKFLHDRTDSSMKDYLGIKRNVKIDYNETFKKELDELFVEDGRPLVMARISDLLNEQSNTAKRFKALVDDGTIEFVKNEHGIIEDVKVAAGRDAGDLKILRPKRVGGATVASDIRLFLPAHSAKARDITLDSSIANHLLMKKSRLETHLNGNKYLAMQRPVIDLRTGAPLKDAAGNVVMEPVPDSVGAVLQCLTGGMPQELQDFLVNWVGHNQNKDLKGWRMFFQSVEHATRYDGESKALVAWGKRVNEAVRVMERRVMGDAMTWQKVIDSGDTAAADDFFKVYSVLRNKGYRIEGFEDSKYGMRAVLDMNDSFTFAKFCDETGLDEETVKGLLSGEVEVDEFTARLFNDNSMKFYAPAMNNPGVPAVITNPTAKQMMTEWAGIQEGLYGMLNHANMIYDTGKSYKPYHIQTPDESLDDLWFVYGKRLDAMGNPSDEVEILGTYTKKVDALRDFQHFTANGKYQMAKLPAQGIDAIEGMNLAQKKAIRQQYEDRIAAGYTTGRASGHWQGNLYDTGIDSITEVYQRLLEESRYAVRQNASSAMYQLRDTLEMTTPFSRMVDYEKIMTGQLPKVGENSFTLDKWFSKRTDGIWRTIRKMQDTFDENEMVNFLTGRIFDAAPKELRSKGKNFISSIAKDISLSMYSGLNLSAAVTNVLSVLQATPMAMQWYNKFPNETKEEWLLRTGLKLGKDMEPVAVSDTALGFSFMRKMATSEGRKEVIEAAEQAGVLTNEMKFLQQALDPMRNTPRKGVLGLVKKGVRGTEDILEKLSGPVFKTEEFSRLAAFGVGYEVATKRFKMAPAQARAWAAGFAETAQGGYGLYSRPGYSNSFFFKHLFMFTTYLDNILTRTLDMHFGGDKLGLIKSNLMSGILFGPKSMPFAKQWLDTHSYGNDAELSTIADLGLSAYTGIAFSSLADNDVTGMFRGVERPLALSAVADLGLLVKDIVSDLITSGGISGQYIMESASVHWPMVGGRRALQAMLGYKVTMNHSLLTKLRTDIEDEILTGARLLAGFSTTQEREFANWFRYQRRVEEAKQKAAAQNKKSMLSRLRSAPYGMKVEAGEDEVDSILNNMLRVYGYDGRMLSTAFMQVMQEADSDLQERIMMKLFKGEKYDPLSLTIMDAITQNQRDLGWE